MSLVKKIFITIAIYLRVSSPEQEREGTSLETQEEACRRKAESAGYHGARVEVFREQGSGPDPDRPLFRELRQNINDGKYAAVFIFDPDRLTRDPLQNFMFRYECEQAGVELHFVKGQGGTSDEDRLIQYVEGYVAQKEWRKISERTIRGKLATARAGRMPVGVAPYGYTTDKIAKRRVIHHAEAAVVRWVYEMYASGIGVRRILSTLVQDGIPTKNGGRWTVQRILKMLRNESYIGVDYFMRTSSPYDGGRRGKRITNPREEWIRITDFTPPIVSVELWEEVQQRLKSAKKRRVSPRRLYLLTQFLWCSKCGKRLHGNSRAGLPRRYRCEGRRGVVRLPPPFCDQPDIDADELEALVWDRLVAAITHPDVLANGLRPHLESGGPDPGKEMRRLRREMKKYQAEEARLIKLYSTGDFNLEVVKGLVAQVQVLLAQHERDLLLLENRDAFNEDAGEKHQRLEEHARRISGELASVDFDAKRATLLAFGVKIVVGEGRVSIELVVDPS